MFSYWISKRLCSVFAGLDMLTLNDRFDDDKRAGISHSEVVVCTMCFSCHVHENGCATATLSCFLLLEYDMCLVKVLMYLYF